MRTGFPNCNAPSPFRRANRGFVLVAVLLVVMALLSGVTAFAWFARTQMRAVFYERFTQESRSIAYVLLHKVALGLLQDPNAYDSLHEPWFSEYVFPTDDGKVFSVTITPLDGKIPVNALFLPDRRTLRRELKYPWTQVLVTLGRSDLESLLLDFLDADKSPRLGGAERGDFPNRALADLSELRNCPGVDETFLEGNRVLGQLGFRDYCDIWGGAKINVNMAPRRVLELLDSEMDDGAATRIVAARKDAPFKSMSDVNKMLPKGAIPRLAGLLGVSSEYFQVDIRVQEAGGSGHAALYQGVLRRAQKECRVVLWKERTALSSGFDLRN